MSYDHLQGHDPDGETAADTRPAPAGTRDPVFAALSATVSEFESKMLAARAEAAKAAEPDPAK